MAYSSSNVKLGTLLSAADFSTTGQFRFGVINSSGKIALASSGGRVDGCVQNNPAADRVVELDILGVTMVEYGGTITAGDEVESGASGVAVTLSGATYAAGIALESGVSGDIRPVLLKIVGAVS